MDEIIATKTEANISKEAYSYREIQNKLKKPKSTFWSSIIEYYRRVRTKRLPVLVE